MSARLFRTVITRIGPALVGAALALAAPAALAQDIASQVPAEYRDGVKSALRGPNAAELKASYAALEGDERIGWAFLVANMPQHHVRKLTKQVLTENVQYAYKARDLPWNEGLSDELFLHYVLPVLSGDEPAQLYRKAFFDEIVPHLKKKGVKSLEKAALEINKFCGQRVTFKSTPPEDAGPLDILERGYGRCEEEGIYYNAVARSAGVPARIAGTPYWTFKASNHAWCEVYTGEVNKDAGREWGYLGACEPAGKLNSAWFSGDIKRGALVLSRAVGTPASDAVLSSRSGYAVINTTRYYTNVCDMTLATADEDGTPVSGADITVYIWNEVGNEPSMRSAFQSATDDEGQFAFELGPGDYLVHASKDGRTGWAVATSKPGGEARCDITLTKPSADPSATLTDGGGGLTVKLGKGGKSVIAGIGKLDTFPWKPDQFVDVEKKGSKVDLAPGWYVVQTGWRKGTSEVLFTLQFVQVEGGKMTTLTLPGPKQTKPSKDGKAYVHRLAYPRK